MRIRFWRPSEKVVAEKPVEIACNKEDVNLAAQYSDSVPSDQNSVDLFAGKWSSELPQFMNSGGVGLFEDARINWILQCLGDISGWNVLELGPLEGGHTFMLEAAGANVTAIEANHEAFLRCLVAKNLYAMRSKFVLGDFMKSFGNVQNADLVVASGVLYHMTEPVELIRKIAAVSSNLFLWTHVFDPDLSVWNPSVVNRVGVKWLPKEMRIDSSTTVDVRIVPQLYADALGWGGFCGGPDTYSNWIYRDDLFALLRHFGYNSIEVAFDQPDHPNGPALALIARK